LTGSGKTFDILTVAYFTRFMRNVKQTLTFRDEMHERGAAVHGIGESTARQHLSDLYRLTGCLNAVQAAYRLSRAEAGQDAARSRRS